MVGAVGHNINVGRGGNEWIDCIAGVPRQVVVIWMQTLLDCGGAFEQVGGPVDRWYES